MRAADSYWSFRVGQDRGPSGFRGRRRVAGGAEGCPGSASAAPLHPFLVRMRAVHLVRADSEPNGLLHTRDGFDDVAPPGSSLKRPHHGSRPRIASGGVMTLHRTRLRRWCVTVS